MLTINEEEKYWNGKKIPYGKNKDFDREVEYAIKDNEDINFLIEAQAVLKEYIEDSIDLDDNDQYLEELCEDDYYLKELGRTYTRMTTSDYYTKWTGYEPIEELADKRIKLVGYKSVLNKYNNLEKYQKPAEYDIRSTELIYKLVCAYRDKYYEAERQSKKIIKGFNGEFEVTVDLKNNLYSDCLKIISGVHFDKYEHDVIVVSDKGIFTLEIKNHSGNLVWENGEFHELVNGMVKDDKITNPYVQCLNHKQSLCNIVDSKYVYSFILFANPNLKYSADDPEIANSLFYIDDFIQYFNDLEPIMTTEEADQLFDTIQDKRIYKDDAFKYVDMDKVDDLYKEWFSNINWKVKDSEQKSELVEEAVNKEKCIEECAKKLINVKSLASKKKDVFQKISIGKESKQEVLFILFVVAYPFLWFALVKFMKYLTTFMGNEYNFFVIAYLLLFCAVFFGGICLFFILATFAFHALGDLLSSLFYMFIDFFKNIKYNKTMSLVDEINEDNHKKAKELIDIYNNEFPEVMELSDKILKYRKRFFCYGWN